MIWEQCLPDKKCVLKIYREQFKLKSTKQKSKLKKLKVDLYKQLIKNIQIANKHMKAMLNKILMNCKLKQH